MKTNVSALVIRLRIPAIIATMLFPVAAHATTLSVTPTNVAPSGSVTATFSGLTSPTSGDWIGVYAVGADNNSYISYIYTSDCSNGWNASSGDCSLTMPATTGNYELRFLPDNGYTSTATSQTVTVASGGDTTAPTVPANLSATVISSSQIDLSWGASTDAVGVTGYKIFRDSNQITTVTGTSYSNTGLTADTDYQYTVSAYDAAGNNSAQTASVLAHTSIASSGWAAPTQAPAGGNTPPPFNVSATSQVKTGGIWAGSVGSDNGYCIGGSCITAWPFSQWTLAGTTIYYSDGNVGIGISSPVTTLDVSSYARLSPQSTAPLTCDVAHKGSISIAVSSSRICVCNGTSWIFNYNGAACAWTADVTPPTISLTTPANNATVSSTAVSVTANASDNVGIAGVQFKLDGSNLGAEDTSSPYGITWNTTLASNGSHTLTAVARDGAGNTTTSAGITVTVSNTPTVVYLTSGTSWTVPSDWNSTNNKIEVIGGGAGGGGSTINAGSGGGGGGAYSAVTNLSLTAGNAITIAIGSAGTGGNNGATGGDTYFNGSNCSGASVCAKGGTGGTQGSTSGGAGGAGGVASNGVGSTKYSGGNGGAGGPNNYGGGGGGGAAGPSGSGGAGGGANGNFGGGGGGGGANNGSAGVTSTGNPGGAGGTGGSSGSTGGSGGASGSAGSAGTKGGGGGGSGNNTGSAAAGAGGAGQEWDTTHGAGGGGGAGGNVGGTGGPGGAAGTYGGGGGGGGDVAGGGAGGNGAAGIIVITYTP